jgi:DNA-binding response OmpR family regulator
MSDQSGARIVIADDDDDIRRLVAFTLARRGHTIIEGSDGEVALSLIAEHHPDLIVLDVMMPGMTGIDVTRQVRVNEATAGTPILLVSAMGQHSEIETGLQAGASDYLVKPFKPKELAEKVQAMLDTARERGT